MNANHHIALLLKTSYATDKQQCYKKRQKNVYAPGSFIFVLYIHFLVLIKYFAVFVHS